MPMEANARLFNCARCHSQVVICSYCDRGNIYCPDCSRHARKQSLCAAGQRYQNSFKGKLRHAARQKRYRGRLRNKVTHHPSPFIADNDLLPQQPNEQKKRTAQPIICHFCGNYCSSFVRLRFLHRRTGGKVHHFSSWPSGP